jgi:arabinose-5-phosphate isomerase
VQKSIDSIMRKNPKTIHASALAVDAVSIMEDEKITAILVVNDSGQLIGIVNSNDLLRAKVI